MKSNTTRRSQPMIRSRLRSPTSKSMTTVLWPRNASPAPKAAALVVLPTPPLPDVMTTTLAKIPPPPHLCDRPCRSAALFSGATAARRNPYCKKQGLSSGDGQPVLNQRDLNRESALLRRQLFADQIMPGDADQFGLQPRAEDPRRDIAAGAGQGPAAQGAVDVDIAVGDQL